MSENNGTFMSMTKTGFLILLVCLFAAMSMLNVATLAYAVHVNGARAAENRALISESLRHDCAQKAYAQGSVETTSNFLASHPGPNPLGIPRDQLVQQLERQRAFRDTFADIDCRGTTP